MQVFIIPPEESVFFTSDTHFLHKQAIANSNRPFADLAEMEETLIRNWNARVGDDDRVFHLGDFSVKKSAARNLELLDRLRGRIVLLRGNHDHWDAEELLTGTKARLEAVCDLAELRFKERYALRPGNIQKVFLCHYPVEAGEWKDCKHGALHLHGHTHTDVPITAPGRVSVCVESWNYRPVSAEEIFRLAGGGLRA